MFFRGFLAADDVDDDGKNKPDIFMCKIFSR